MAVFTEVIQLDDKVSAPAAQAKAAVSALGSSTVAAQGALAQVSSTAAPAGKAMGTLGSKTFDAANAMAVGKETISAAMGGIKSAITSLASGDVKGAIAGITDTVSALAKSLDLLVPGLGEAVAAMVGLAGGAAGAVVSLAKFAIEVATAYEQTQRMFEALGEGKISGDAVMGMLDDLSAKLGQTKEAMIPLAKAFLTMGITGKEALEELTTAALSAQALGGTSEAFVSLEKKIQAAAESGTKLKIKLAALTGVGLHVEDVASKMGISAKELGAQLKSGAVDAKKFGDAMTAALIEKGAGPLETMGLSLSNLGAMLKQYVGGDIFEDMMPAIKPFLLALKDMFGILDSKTKPSGEAIKTGIVAYLTKLFQVATKIIPVVKHFLLDMIIYGLKAFIAIKPIVAKVKEFATSAQGAKIIGQVMASLWTVLKVVGVVILVVVAAIWVLWAAMIAVSVVVWTVVGAIIDMTTSISTTLGGWVISAATAAYDFIAGLVKGISGGAAAVIAAVTGVVGGAIDAAKKKLGIASPSKVMMQLGGQTGEGFAGGLGDAANDVHGAASGMAQAAVKGASTPGTASSSGSTGTASSSGGTVIHVNVQIDGAGKSAQEITDEMVSQVFQRYALAAGL